MGRKLRQVGWITLFFGGALLGCHKSAVQHKEPPDPLLVSKPPVEGRARTSHSSPIVPAERTPPPPAPGGSDSPLAGPYDTTAPLRPVHLEPPLFPE